MLACMIIANVLKLNCGGKLFGIVGVLVDRIVFCRYNHGAHQG